MLELQKGVAALRADAERLDAQVATEADSDARATLEAKARDLRSSAEAKEARAAKIIESEQKRNWEVHDKFDYSAVNAKGPHGDSKKKGGGAKASSGSAGAAGTGTGTGGSGTGGQWELVHDPSGAPAAAAGSEPTAEEEGEEDEEEDINAYVQVGLRSGSGRGVGMGVSVWRRVDADLRGARARRVQGGCSDDATGRVTVRALGTAPAWTACLPCG